MSVSACGARTHRHIRLSSSSRILRISPMWSTSGISRRCTLKVAVVVDFAELRDQPAVFDFALADADLQLYLWSSRADARG